MIVIRVSGNTVQSVEAPGAVQKLLEKHGPVVVFDEDCANSNEVDAINVLTQDGIAFGCATEVVPEDPVLDQEELRVLL